MSDPIHSTGRGGAGNIGPDTSSYVDGTIVREGPLGESDRGEYSAGRGGAGNIAPSPRTGTPVPQKSEDFVPETATRTGEGHEDFHTGRGGGGNVHREKYGGHSGPQHEGHEKKEGGLLEKAKSALGMGHKEGHKEGGAGTS